MEEANEREPPVTVNVKALANYFQSLNQRDNGRVCDLVASTSASRYNKPSSQCTGPCLPVTKLGLPPASTSTSPSSLTSLSCSDSFSSSDKQHDNHEQRHQPPEALKTSGERVHTKHKQSPPVPLPRISLIRKQTAYGSSPKNNDDQSIYCDIINTSHEDDFYSHHAEDDSDNHDDQEDIYEEIPDSFYSSHPELQCASRQHNNNPFKSDQINRKLSSSLQKIKIVLQRSLGDESRRKASLFQFTKDRKLPKPPSVEQLERPFRSSSHDIYQDKCNEVSKQQSDYYYDIQEVASCTGSDEYYICIDDDELPNDVDRDEEDGYEQIIHPVTPEVKTDSPATGKSTTYDNCVQYAEIDPVLTRELEKKIEKDQKRLERRRKEHADKLLRSFGLTGLEVPVNYGTVKADAGRSRGRRLRVKKGETVLVLRMQGNPPGFYLAKNERSEVGYVELCNIEFDPESIKAIMRVDTEVSAS